MQLERFWLQSPVYQEAGGGGTHYGSVRFLLRRFDEARAPRQVVCVPSCDAASDGTATTRAGATPSRFYRYVVSAAVVHWRITLKIANPVMTAHELAQTPLSHENSFSGDR